MFKRSHLIAVPLFLASGCMLGPEYDRPDLPIPPRFQTTQSEGDSIANVPWWDLFNDKNLQELIRASLDQNRDLAVASARIDGALATLGISQSALLPRVDAFGQAKRVSISEEIFETTGGPQNNFGLFGSLTYELDVWGRLRRATRAAEADLIATEFGRRAIVVTLVSQVASTYVRIAGIEDRLSIARRTYKNRQGATHIIDARFKQGVLPQLDLNQAEIQEQEAAVSTAVLERQLKQSENALNLLLGRAPTPLARPKALKDYTLKGDVPTGFPAQLLERRPDLLAAEARAKASVERIGVAEAGRLPSFSLTGFIGLQSKETDALFQGSARTWGFGTNFIGPLIDWGKSKSQVEAAEAEARAIAAQYEQSVLQAVQEVENALIGIRTYKAEYEHRRAQVESASNAARLSRARYDDGMTSYLEVLDIERSLFEAELGASDAFEQYLASIVKLYAALGGGWSGTSDKDPKSAQK